MTVFISRYLGPDSVFRSRLTAAGYRLTGRSLIEFEAVPFRDVPSTDWIFFYSRRAVTFFFDQLAGPLKEVRLATFGAGTAEALRSYGYRPDFTGSGKPETVARDFLPHARGQRVLFPRARQSRQSVQRALGDAVVAIDLVVYDNRPSREVPSRDFDVLVFTSPMNARAYFQQRERRPGQRVIAIGRTTAAALQQLQIKELEVALEPSEEGMAKAVIEGSKD
jgi:uroporphyrinogen-III synthase